MASKSLGRTPLPSVKCDTFSKSGGSCDRAICNFGLGLSKKMPKVRYILQICITIVGFVAASIGEVRNFRQIQVVSKSLGRIKLLVLLLPRSVKCVTVVKNREVSKSIARAISKFRSVKCVIVAKIRLALSVANLI